MSLTTFIKHNCLTVVCTIVALILSLYLYKVSCAPSEPILLVDPAATILIDSTRVSAAPLQVVKVNGEEIIGDVTSIRFYFWNASRKAIKPSNVLEPLVITLDNAESEILDYRILKSSRPVIKSVLERHIADPNRSLAISFKILERNDGFTGQIILRGAPTTDLVLSGTVEGLQKITTYNRDIQNDVWKLKLHYIFAPTFCSLAFIFLSGLYYSRLTKEKPALTIKEKIIESYKAYAIWFWMAWLFLIFVPGRIQNADKQARSELIKRVPKDLYIQIDSQKISSYGTGKKGN